MVACKPLFSIVCSLGIRLTKEATACRLLASTIETKLSQGWPYHFTINEASRFVVNFVYQVCPFSLMCNHQHGYSQAFQKSTTKGRQEAHIPPGCNVLFPCSVQSSGLTNCLPLTPSRYLDSTLEHSSPQAETICAGSLGGYSLRRCTRLLLLGNSPFAETIPADEPNK